LLVRINITSLALMMPSGAVHSIIPGPAKPEPGIHNPERLGIIAVCGYGFRAPSLRSGRGMTQ
jgi:hypothetical protein